LPKKKGKKRAGRPPRARQVLPPGVAFLLLDTSLRPVYATAEAARILAYPDKPEPLPTLGNSLQEKIQTVIRRAGSAKLPSVVEFQSGRRRYFCRIFPLESNPEIAVAPNVAVVLERTLQGMVDVPRVAQQYSLSPREQQVLELLIQGLSSKEIAERMRISPNTVKAFLRLIMVKMSVSTRSEIVAKVLKGQT
jgi:DNA-binding CsgD family transcriptional regulator